MFEVSEAQEHIIQGVRDFMEREVRPIVKEYDLPDKYPHALVEKMKEYDFFGFTVPEAYGGVGLDVVTYARVIEEIARVWMSVTGIINSHLLLAYCIHEFGTADQKDRYLPRMASGELRAGIALTEPDAGSDLQAIRTVAERRNDVYLVNGSKMFITNGYEGSLFGLLVKTDVTAEPRHRGISLLIAEKGHPGLKVVRKVDKLGYRGVDTAEFLLDNYEVRVENLLGGKEGLGFQQIMAGLELGRINVAARGVGLAQAALEDSLRYAQQRHTFGRPIAHHQAIQLKLADMATKVEAARLLVARAAWKKQQGERADMESGMAKLFATEVCAEVSLEAMRIHGGYGYTTQFDVERYYRDAPLMLIGEGTNEIQRLIISRQLLARHPVVGA